MLSSSSTIRMRSADTWAGLYAGASYHSRLGPFYGSFSARISVVEHDLGGRGNWHRQDHAQHTRHLFAAQHGEDGHERMDVHRTTDDDWHHQLIFNLA